MPGFYSDLQHDPAYSSIPSRIDEEELERRVIALRSGDTSQVNPICVQMLRLAMSLVANFAHPRRTPDLVGTASMTLVEAVNAAATKLSDNNIIPFVSEHINRRLKDMIARDHVVAIPPRTLRYLRSKGIEAFVPATDSVVGLEGIARPELPSLECRDLLAKIVHDDQEKLLLELKAERRTLEEIAGKMGISLSSAQRMRAELRTRFNELNADKD